MHPPSHTHPRPFYRSRLLWFALPGLLFLLSGWLNDPDYNHGIRLTLGDHILRIADEGRTLCIDPGTYRPGKWTAPGFSSYRRYNQPGLRPNWYRLFSQPFHHEDRSNSTYTGWMIHLAYWPIILLYATLLLVTLSWWQRRKTRLTTTPPIPSHDPTSTNGLL
ncbi:hypothetical protein [Luteolibacter soli]|uniref:Uncharacterized protein n=1 Tax=Luteolibacter soli TaxID=3135280 RepID=A0ABU9AW63_9BACT